VIIEGGHFDRYLSMFQQSSEAAVEWFKLHLGQLDFDDQGILPWLI
jgi:hypothetical protein